jgi:hypothetical protein
MITERVVANGLKPGNQFWVVASMLNVGELPAIIKNTKMTERIVSQRVTYSEPMTWKDINDADVIKPPGTFPVGAIGPGQRIGLPLQSAAVSAEVLKGIMDGSFFFMSSEGSSTKRATLSTTQCSAEFMSLAPGFL